MKTKAFLETVDALLARDGDTSQEEINCESPSLLQTIPYEHERFLVAWVLLTRFPQDQLDRAWGKHGKDLDRFAQSLLTNFGNGVDIFVRHHDVSKNDGHNFFFHACCTRLVAQVTARLTTTPSKELRDNIYKSWKQISSLKAIRNTAETSPANEAAILRSTIIPLCVDVYNAYIGWMDQDVPFFSSDLILNEIWKVPIAASTRLRELLEEESGEEQKDSSGEVQPKFKENERTMMFKVLESVLGTSSEDEKMSTDRCEEDSYTIGNLQRLIFVIFELKGTDCASFELITSILLWSTTSREDIFDADLTILWDGWLMKTIGERITEEANGMSLLRDPEIMSAIQKLSMAHAVSPDTNTLRPMAWQIISRIMRVCGWRSMHKSSIEASICLWCRLACGEWKIQLEEEGFSECSYRSSILDGCGKLIITVVQYLVDFHDSPHKPIPLGTESILSLRETLEDTLSLTSTYLNAHLSDTTPAILIHLWSELFSEITLSASKDASVVFECFRNLLLVSDNECLLPASVHVVTTYCTEDGFLYNVQGLDTTVIDSILLYLERFWKTMATRDSLKKHCGHDTIHSACVATEILAEYQPDKVENVTIAILDVVDFLAESAPDLRLTLRLVVDSSIFLFDRFRGSTLAKENLSSKISSAVKILQDT